MASRRKHRSGPRSRRKAILLRFNDSPRDIAIEQWFEDMIQLGISPTESLKNSQYELITGNSSLTGRPIVMSAAVESEMALKKSTHPAAHKLARFGD